MVHDRNLRHKIGVVVKDLPRYMKLLHRENDYLAIRNRYEMLELAPDNSGYRCDWEWTSDLHAPKVFPFLGRRLFRRAFGDHPINLSVEPLLVTQHPEVTFIIGHRGLERVPLLEITLASIAGQRDVAIECIVVEQDTQPLLKGRLPAWVRYIHAPPPHPDMAYNRSLAFNLGVQFAKGDLLILHDNDMPVSRDYAAANLAKAREGYEVVNLKRFIFYLDRQTSGNVSITRGVPGNLGVDAIVQNLQAGGSIAIKTSAYFAIGGMDESFVGWGGEDNEFWGRALTRRVYPFGYLPLIHLWHKPQPEKELDSRQGSSGLYWELAKIDPKERVRLLKESLSGVDPAC